MQTYSNTDESCWSPHIKISAIHLNDSTSKPLLFSDTVWFFSSVECKYFKWSRESRFLGLFQPPPNQLRLRNILRVLWEADYWASLVFVIFAVKIPNYQPFNCSYRCGITHIFNFFNIKIKLYSIWILFETILRHEIIFGPTEKNKLYRNISCLENVSIKEKVDTIEMKENKNVWRLTI